MNVVTVKKPSLGGVAGASCPPASVAVLSAAVNNHTRIRALGICGGMNNYRWDLTRLLLDHDAYDLWNSIGGQALSRNGEWIAFVSTDPGGDEIYRVDPTGAVSQRLTFNTWEWDKHPSWSPDGDRFVTIVQPSDTLLFSDLFIVDSQGAMTRLTYTAHHDQYPSWSPTGEWIAFAHDTNVNLIRPDGSDLHTLPIDL